MTREPGCWVVVPEPGDLVAWEMALSLSDLPPDTRAAMSGMAQLIRRAVILDGARPGENVWIDFDEVTRVVSGRES